MLTLLSKKLGPQASVRCSRQAVTWIWHFLSVLFPLKIFFENNMKLSTARPEREKVLKRAERCGAVCVSSFYEHTNLNQLKPQTTPGQIGICSSHRSLWTLTSASGQDIERPDRSLWVWLCQWSGGRRRGLREWRERCANKQADQQSLKKIIIIAFFAIVGWNNHNQIYLIEQPYIVFHLIVKALWLFIYFFVKNTGSRPPSVCFPNLYS